MATLTEPVVTEEQVDAFREQGFLTVHTDGTLHYTDGNRSADRLRRAYIFNFRPAGSSEL